MTLREALVAQLPELVRWLATPQHADAIHSHHGVFCPHLLPGKIQLRLATNSAKQRVCALFILSREDWDNELCGHRPLTAAEEAEIRGAFADVGVQIVGSWNGSPTSTISIVADVPVCDSLARTMGQNYSACAQGLRRCVGPGGMLPPFCACPERVAKYALFKKPQWATEVQ